MMKCLYTAFALVLSGGLFAQSNQLSIGVDAALPMGDFGDAFNLGIGPAVGFELPVGDNLALTAQVSYMFLMPESSFIKSASMLPAQLGAKYHLAGDQTGLYFHGMAGIHSTRITTEDLNLGIITIPGQSSSESNFSWGVGVGFQLEKLDIGVRYNSITPGDTPGATASNYIGARIGYLLSF